MAIQFVVEDGTGITGANTYLSLVDARQIAENFGLELPIDDNAAMVTLINGAAFLERFNYKGRKLVATQGLAWPRVDVYVDCNLVASNSVPSEIKQAQVFAAAYASTSELRAATDGKEVQREKLDTLEVEYFESGKTNAVVTIPEVTDRLRKYMLSGSRAVRI